MKGSPQSFCRRFLSGAGGGLALLLLLISPSGAADRPLRIVALGDSLTAGYGLESEQDFAAQLQAALKTEGIDAHVENAGVSGDTSAGGLARLEWAMAGEPKVDLMIVALGANDLFRGIDPRVTRENLETILRELESREIKSLLIGMQSPEKTGVLFKKRYDRIFPDLAEKHRISYYPNFLDGVAMKPELNLQDGIHPNAKGVEVMVRNILPTVKEAIAGIKTPPTEADAP